MPTWFTSPQAVTRPSTNPAWRRGTLLIGHNALPLRHATSLEEGKEEWVKGGVGNPFHTFGFLATGQIVRTSCRKYYVALSSKWVSVCSDNYIMKWGNQGMPKDLDQLNNLRVIFTVCCPAILFLLRSGWFLRKVSESRGILRSQKVGENSEGRKVRECKITGVQKLTKMLKNFFKMANMRISLLAYLSEILIVLLMSRFGDFGAI